MELIYRNLSEVIGKDRIEEKLAQNRTLTCYIGFAPTGPLHLGYLVPCVKIRDLTLAGCRVAIMIADVHSFLDERKTPKDLVEVRSDYYRKVLTFILQLLGADMKYIRFVRGSEFQLTAEYSMEVWDLASRVTIASAKKAGTEVVKQTKDPKLGSAFYPLMQATDENYVGQCAFGTQIDIELGGLDQRKIFCFSYDNNGKISYFMTPIISLAKNGKMSASDNNGKISLTDSDAEIELKIKKAFCCDGDPDCGLMKLIKCVFFPLDRVSIDIDDMIIHYFTYETFEDDFVKGIFVSPHLKKTITSLIIDIVRPIRDYLASDPIHALTIKSYPTH